MVDYFKEKVACLCQMVVFWSQILKADPGNTSKKHRITEEEIKEQLI